MVGVQGALRDTSAGDANKSVEGIVVKGRGKKG